MRIPISRWAASLLLLIGCGSDAEQGADATVETSADVVADTGIADFVDPEFIDPETIEPEIVGPEIVGPEIIGQDAQPEVVDTIAEVDGAEPSDTAPNEVEVELPASCELAAEVESFGGNSWRVATVDPRCTDLAITNCTLDGDCLKEQKDHLILVPDDITRQELWVHLGGSGGKPTNAKNIARAAATAGHRVIGLAYLNEPSIASRCVNPDTGVSYEDECLEKTRFEVIYGEDSAPWIQIGVPDSIVSRLEHLLAWLVEEQPNQGWDGYLDATGRVRWDRVGLSGFSQGGGHVGLIGRDQALYRSVFFSKGAGTVGHLGGACTSTADCVGGALCCDLGAGECEEEATDGGTCVEFVIAPWTLGGVGGALDQPRATPGSRMYGIINTNETAWRYSPEVFERWGMGARADIVSADPESAGPFNGAHVLSSSLPPCGTGSEHQSMGTDAIEPKIGGCGGNRPAMFNAWLYMMTHVDPN